MPIFLDQGKYGCAGTVLQEAIDQAINLTHVRMLQGNPFGKSSKILDTPVALNL
jgi:hypothetical protein